MQLIHIYLRVLDLLGTSARLPQHILRHAGRSLRRSARTLPAGGRAQLFLLAYPAAAAGLSRRYPFGPPDEGDAAGHRCIVGAVAEPILLLNDGSAAARPVDVKGMCTTGPEDEFDGYWRALCALVGVDYERVPVIQTTVDRLEVRASYNGGLLAARRASGISSARKNSLCDWRLPA